MTISSSIRTSARRTIISHGVYEHTVLHVFDALVRTRLVVLPIVAVALVANEETTAYSSWAFALGAASSYRVGKYTIIRISDALVRIGHVVLPLDALALVSKKVTMVFFIWTSALGAFTQGVYKLTVFRIFDAPWRTRQVVLSQEAITFVANK